MSGLGVAFIAAAIWLALSPLVGVLLGRAIRSNTRTPTDHTPGPHTPTWARQKNRRRR